MRYLITGGAGFIGSHLAEYLIDQGDQVTSLDIAATHYRVPGVYYVHGNVMDEKLIRAVVPRHDAVFHLASVCGFATVMREPVRTIQSGTLGAAWVFAVAAEHQKRVLFTSTSAVYGRNGASYAKETDDAHLGSTGTVSWSYAYTKALNECLAFSYATEDHLPVIVCRLFNTVGPRQSAEAGFVLPRFVRQALAGEPLTVHKPGSQARTFCHVKDTVGALAGLMECDDAVGQLVNVGGIERVSMERLAERVVEVTHSPSVIRLVDQPYGPGYDNVTDRSPDLTKLQSLTGYTPHYGLDKMIRDTAMDLVWHGAPA